MITIVDVMGVDIRSAPMFARDCAFPITDWVKRCPPDQVVANIPVHLGAWENGTIAPSLTDYEDQVDTTGMDADGCDAPVVRTTLESCNLIAPDMKEISFQTPKINWRDIRTQFCRQRNILPNQLCVFDNNGNLAVGQPYTIDFIKFALQALARVFAKQITRSIMIGDAANLNEVDGIYTQIDNGWDAAGADPCNPDLNHGVVIDWNALCGNPHGTGCAYPDDKTIAGGTINIWGEIHEVPAGLTLADFFEDLWIDKVNIDWADSRGGVDSWEMHMHWGQAKCFLHNAACMKPCSGCNDFDTGLRERFANLMNAKMVELYPSHRRFPILETRYVPKNTIRFGPRSIGGRPTYGVFFENIDRYLNTLPDTYGGHMGMPEMTDNVLVPETETLLREMFENQTVFWDVNKLSAKCIRALIMAFYGVLVCSRHLWLRIDNVCCPSFVGDCDSHLSIDGTPVTVP